MFNLSNNIYSKLDIETWAYFTVKTAGPKIIQLGFQTWGFKKKKKKKNL